MHGTRYCYQQGCREPECCKANRDYQRGYNHRKPQLPTINDLAAELLREVQRHRSVESEMEKVRWLPVPKLPESRVANAEFLFERVLDGMTYPEIGKRHGVTTSRARERVFAGAPVVLLCALAVKEGLE